MHYRARTTTIQLIQGDITKVEADALVNAANSRLAGGGGVDGAIHRAGGPSILEECRQIGTCPAGSAVATRAGSLKARYVIHAVAPIWSGGSYSEAALLGGAYRTSLGLAEQLNATSIAFPSLGTGAYGYPISQAAPLALKVVYDHIDAGTTIKTVIFVLFSQADLATYEAAAASVFEPATP